ncbi:hypothetical protein CUJ83_05100 [Methanocella sp. CWC-04]|uniref:DUF2178 domain-containing protein n=1 Tax=Methanooceanicella nereidis TaxID=2052831 RepID=A0AAP2W4K2_9EURY|nr:hypothetical protein [Methanocella sp. CWC-04]MCD1294375.1 hypothetical protein [Methanocella sp. CWC-04]
MKNRHRIGLMAGVAALLLSILIKMYYPSADMIIFISLFNAGIMLIIFNVYYIFKNGETVDADERTKRISSTAMSYSWFITFISICILVWADYFGIISLTGMQALMIVMIMMSVLIIVFKWYFGMKGDFE